MDKNQQGGTKAGPAAYTNYNEMNKIRNEKILFDSLDDVIKA